MVPGFGSYLHVADLAKIKRTSGRRSNLGPVPVCPGSVPVGHNRFHYPFRSSNPDPGPIPLEHIVCRPLARLALACLLGSSSRRTDE